MIIDRWKDQVATLGKKQASYSQNAREREDFSFNCAKHIIDLSDILHMVPGLRPAAQERVLTEFSTSWRGGRLHQHHVGKG
ncbi:MAG: hypothetical protein QM605_00130 [Sphingobium sp.]